MKSASAIAKNPNAFHNYEISKTLEAGVVLLGWETKAIREGRVNLREGYAGVHGGEVWLKRVHITPPSSFSTHFAADPMRDRKLLLHGKEIDECIRACGYKGYTLVPLRLYWKKNRIKLALALARGKKKYDKRAEERSAAWERKKHQLLKISSIDRSGHH